MFLGSEVVCTVCYCIISSEDSHSHFSCEAHCERYLVSLVIPEINIFLRNVLMRVGKRDKGLLKDIVLATLNSKHSLRIRAEWSRILPSLDWESLELLFMRFHISIILSFKHVYVF